MELAYPLHKLLNKIVETAKWPAQYKREYVTPLGKVPQPETEDDLRPISLTSFFSKVMEQFVVTWLLEVIGDRIDFRQYGGMKGNSISHYLIELINFILFNQDKTDPTAVIACLIDFSKAFNRQNHNILITKLSDMGVPSWLLRLVMAFLEDRSMVVRYKGATSDVKWLPGGGPQGTLLGLLLFLVLINDLGFENQTNNVGELVTCKKRIKDFNLIHLKYVDDLSIAEAVNMKQLDQRPVESRPQPDDFHDRTGHTLKPEDSQVFKQLVNTNKYAEDNGMQINFKKTKMILFNPGTIRDFHPRFNLSGHDIDLIEETKLLGVVIRSDLGWSSNTNYIVARANKKLWFLRRLKKLGASQDDLKDVFVKQIRSILEFAVPVWHNALVGEDRLQIERVQKSALRIILGDKYISYTSALKSIKLETLFKRRQKLCKTFALKCYRSKKFRTWFKPNDRQTSTRQVDRLLLNVHSRTRRYERSPISYITELLNRAKSSK